MNPPEYNDISYNVPRIDVYMLRLTRDYFSILPTMENDSITPLANQDRMVSQRQLMTGYTSPLAFTFCDSLGMIQDAHNVLVTYHWRRNKANKRPEISYSDFLADPSKARFSTALPKRDRNDFHRLNFEKYWWLSADSAHIRYLKGRRVTLLRARPQ